MNKGQCTLQARIAQAKPIPYRLTPQAPGQTEDPAGYWKLVLARLREAGTTVAALVLSTCYGGRQGRAEQLEAAKAGLEFLAEQANAAAAAIGAQLAELARRAR